nr:malic enzyme-like NAD(P)-binding protein [Rhodococcus sp. (in: high G+C Gram-positive bacteria)]
MTELTTDSPVDRISTDDVLTAHVGGKLSVELTTALDTGRDLSIAYTPGVAQVCTLIAEDPIKAMDYTWTGRLVAVVTDGSAVLGLGNIGPRASLPVMEGKSALLRKFAGLNSIPLVLDTGDVDEIVDTIVRLRHSFGAVNLEDISAPRCFEIERRVIEALDYPVMHDDQHGTAIVVLAALMGAATLQQRSLRDLRIVISGAGAAGVACANILLGTGIRDVVVLDSRGILSLDRTDMHAVKNDLAARTNPRRIVGTSADALIDADVFIGVSAGQIAEAELATMAPRSVIFALSNPTPEVHPTVARNYAEIVATGRSDFPNQINNVLAFPGVFKGALDAGAPAITENMKVAAAQAIADIARPDLSADKIVPHPFDDRVVTAVADAVATTARRDGVLRT